MKRVSIFVYLLLFLHINAYAEQTICLKGISNMYQKIHGFSEVGMYYCMNNNISDMELLVFIKTEEYGLNHSGICEDNQLMEDIDTKATIKEIKDYVDKEKKERYFDLYYEKNSIKYFSKCLSIYEDNNYKNFIEQTMRKYRINEYSQEKYWTIPKD